MMRMSPQPLAELGPRFDRKVSGTALSFSVFLVLRVSALPRFCDHAPNAVLFFWENIPIFLGNGQPPAAHA
jgi:hypothetical protein